MDETKATIKRGCMLARDLEENLDNMANQPELLSRYCDDIISVFSHVKERISYANMILGVGRGHEQSQQQLEVNSGIQEWLRSGQAKPMDHLLRAQAQLFGSSSEIGVHGGVRPEPAAGNKMKEIDQQAQAGGLEEMVRRDAEVSRRFRDDVQSMEVSNASRGSSSMQRQRRRRDEGEKRTERVPAPRMGNTEIPPEDGYTWRKYGQKDILNSKFPRSYFRCTHQKLYRCPAKKQVQRLDDNPDIFEVTYRGEHTCHLSSTAPSVPPPPLQIFHPSPAPGSPSYGPLSHWLSMDIIRPPAGGGTSSVTAGMQMRRDFNLPTAGTSNSGAGPSSAAALFENYPGVADMADVMFNSGSSSNNSMDIIFSSMDDKWDPGEKKN